MALIVQKYGGTSVGNLDCIRHVSKKILKAKAEGHQLVVVVSAMSGETDRLVALAQALSEAPNPRELDVLLATGEQTTIALLCMALIQEGCPARSYTGGQVYIRTDSAHTKARILGIDSAQIRADLELGIVVVVAGFQGIDAHGNITTLGRGGSDTTAVALAASLQADECQIYTDVDGVYTADPKMVPFAQRMSELTFTEMSELASQGAKVMQIRAVEFAGQYRVPVRILSTFVEGPGTFITQEYSLERTEHAMVSGLAYTKDEVRFVLRRLPDQPGIAAKILGPLSNVHIEVDMIIQTASMDGYTDLSFLVHKRDLYQAKQLVTQAAADLTPNTLEVTECIAKISLVGIGLRSHPRVASTLFQILGDNGINIQLIATSEVKVSVVIEEKHLLQGLNMLHKAFELGKELKRVGIHS